MFQEDLRSWLLDPDCNDEYSVIHSGGEKVSILWNTPQESVLIRERAVSFPVIPSNKRKSGVGSGFCFFLFFLGGGCPHGPKMCNIYYFCTNKHDCIFTENVLLSL